jgi:glycosyltransferase involved in cell wall biosynthesis
MQSTASPAVRGASFNVNSAFNPCLLIPVFNHGPGLAETLVELAPLQHAVIVVDDGSDAASRAIIDAAVQGRTWVRLIRRAQNGGKGAAVKEGLELAQRCGYSHVLQIDADRQHDCADIERFLAESRAHPASFVIGAARFNESVPRIRRIARGLTHFWVRINTLSFDIEDSMCGFRVYPIAIVMPLLREIVVGNHMQFDMEILVRAHWRGHTFVNVPTNVNYPVAGVSHFRLFRDNVLISAMHTKLFFGMLFQLPTLLRRRVSR